MRPNDSEKLRLKKVLQCMKRAGFPTLVEFHDSYFICVDVNMDRGVHRFFESGGMKSVLVLMFAHLKVVSMTTSQLQDNIGEEVVDVCIQLLRLEIRFLHRSPMMRMDLLKLTTEDCRDFSFQRMIEEFQDKCTFLSQLVRKLAIVKEVDVEDDPEPGDDEDPAVPAAEQAYQPLFFGDNPENENAEFGDFIGD